MLQFFRTNQLLLSALLIVYAAILRIAYFQISIPEVETEVGGIANLYLEGIAQQSGIFIYSISILFLFAQAYLVNMMFFENRLNRDLSLYAGVFLVLLSSFLPAFLQYSSFLPANVFMLLSLRELLKVYRKSSAADILFNVGFFLGLASLFQPIYLIFLLFAAVAVIKLKSGKFRDQFTLIAGWLTPLFLIGTYYFWNDQFDFFWTRQWQNAWSLPQLFTWQDLNIVPLLLMFACLLFTLTSYTTILSKTKMEVQIKIGAIYWYLLAALLCMLFSQPWDLAHWQAVLPIIGLLMGIWFTKVNKNTAEAWHLALVALLFILHFTDSFSVLF